MAHHVVVGGGITGLAAAYALVHASGDVPQRVTLIEAEERLGGTIRSRAFAGATVDLGPEAFVARVPEARALCAALGLEEDLVAPTTGKTAVWTRRRLRPLPDGLVHGIPTSAGAIARSGILSPGGVVRAGLDLLLPRTGTAARSYRHAGHRSPFWARKWSSGWSSRCSAASMQDARIASAWLPWRHILPQPRSSTAA